MRGLCFIFLLVELVCCGQPRKDCSEFANAATRSLMRYHENGSDSTNLVQALGFSEKAVHCDSSNVFYYDLKFNALYLLGRNREGLILLDKMWKLSGHRDIKMMASKGLLYEKIGLPDSAKEIYRWALKECDKRLTNHPPDSVRMICDKLYILAIDKGKEYALKDFDNYYSASKDATLSAFRDYLRDFDKKRILFTQY